jgi:REP element-mobilizing transposase RayT
MMDLFFEQRKRRSIRLQNHDYGDWGYYFVTIKTQGNRPLFGSIQNNHMVLNDYGRIVSEEWQRSAFIRGEIRIDEFIVMPDHLHGIVIIDPDKTYEIHKLLSATADSHVTPTGGRYKNQKASLSSLISEIKSSITSQINKIRKCNQPSIWQRNYHERIIRDADELNAVRKYIRNNPSKWRG